MPDDDPLTPAELAFRELVRNPRRFAAFAEACRLRWVARKTKLAFQSEPAQASVDRVSRQENIR
jgi:hypothetical protein